MATRSFVFFNPPSSSSSAPRLAQQEPQRYPRKPRFVFWAAIFLFFIVASLTFADVIVWVDGVPQLHPKRKSKLEREKKEIEEAEQYALLAGASGLYDCYSCASGKTLLHIGEVWKYGVTRKGESGRYNLSFMNDMKLDYRIQMKGNYAQCLIAEKEKIYQYPLLPENLARPDSLKLAYPPGNRQDK